MEYAVEYLVENSTSVPVRDRPVNDGDEVFVDGVIAPEIAVPDPLEPPDIM